MIHDIHWQQSKLRAFKTVLMSDTGDFCYHHLVQGLFSVGISKLKLDISFRIKLGVR